jgi:hypothetical protein
VERNDRNAENVGRLRPSRPPPSQSDDDYDGHQDEQVSKSIRTSHCIAGASVAPPRYQITCWTLGRFRRAPWTVHGLAGVAVRLIRNQEAITIANHHRNISLTAASSYKWRPPSHRAKLATWGEGAMWKSELAVLIYLAVVVWTGVAARPLVARYLVAPPPIQWRLVP